VQEQGPEPSPFVGETRPNDGTAHPRPQARVFGGVFALAIDNTVGSITLLDSLLGPVPTAAGVTGTGVLARISFTALEASPTQLQTMRRVGRPPLGETPRQLIAIRLDATVLAQFRKEARRRRVGYQTLINEVLAEYDRKDVA
jgi:uncharacterized protein (DUF4415 family)